MKIFEAIKAKRLNQVAPRTRFAFFEAKYDQEEPTPMKPAHWRWKFGAEVFCVFEGPEEGREQYAKHARRLIAQELYGEVCEDLMELTRLLMEEGYRGSGDPVLNLIEDMRRKMRGESV